MFPAETVESVGWLDELEKQYDDPIAYLQNAWHNSMKKKQKKQAPINFTFYDSDRLVSVITCEKTSAMLR